MSDPDRCPTCESVPCVGGRTSHWGPNFVRDIRSGYAWPNWRILDENDPLHVVAGYVDDEGKVIKKFVLMPMTLAKEIK